MRMDILCSTVSNSTFVFPGVKHRARIFQCGIYDVDVMIDGIFVSDYFGGCQHASVHGCGRSCKLEQVGNAMPPKDTAKAEAVGYMAAIKPCVKFVANCAHKSGGGKR